MKKNNEKTNWVGILLFVALLVAGACNHGEGGKIFSFKSNYSTVGGDR